VEAYKTVPIGDPLQAGTLCGPVHTKQAVEVYKKVIADVAQQVSVDIPEHT